MPYSWINGKLGGTPAVSYNQKYTAICLIDTLVPFNLNKNVHGPIAEKPFPHKTQNLEEKKDKQSKLKENMLSNKNVTIR